VAPKYRGLDYGSHLLIAIEKQAIEAGAKVLTVSTQCFQALDFYKKHEYEVFGELKDVPFEGVTKYYLSKRM
jgi:ribosomal protein S18 acetylase RimI-like enzyme